MSMPSAVPSIDAWVGLDWADKRHDVRVQAANSSQVEAFQLEQKTRSPSKLGRRVAPALPPRHVAIALEPVARSRVIRANELRFPGALPGAAQDLGQVPGSFPSQWQ